MTALTLHAEHASDTAAGSAEALAARLCALGKWVILGAIVPLGLWLAFAPLSTAVVATGVVKVDLNRRVIQHQEGGTIKAVMVRDGARVRQGDPILLLGDVRVDADKNRIDYRHWVELATVARLEAEVAQRKSMAFAADLLAAAESDARIEQAMHKERAQFQSGRDALDEHVRLLGQQRDKVRDEIDTVQAQIDKGEASLASQRKELAISRGLLKDGFISANRITQMEAGVQDYDARLEERRTELARARQRLVEIDLKISALRAEYVQRAGVALKEANTRLNEIEQEARKHDDAAARQVVSAPVAGEVIALRFKTAGAVVAPREPIAEIVPADSGLVIETRVRPEDIVHLSPGQTAKIKFAGYKYQSSKLVQGNVAYIGADRLVDPNTGEAYYPVQVRVDATSLADIAGVRGMQAGMAAEIYIQGDRITPLEYLLEPISVTLRRAARTL